jgi:hypothetical protein
MSGDLGDVLSAVMAGVREAQEHLDEAGRDSIDAFGGTGVPPTALAWSSVAVTAPLGLAVLPGHGPGATGRVTRDGPARLTVRVGFRPAPQGGEA